MTKSRIPPLFGTKKNVPTTKERDPIPVIPLQREYPVPAPRGNQPTPSPANSAQRMREIDIHMPSGETRTIMVSEKDFLEIQARIARMQQQTPVIQPDVLKPGIAPRSRQDPPGHIQPVPRGDVPPTVPPSRSDIPYREPDRRVPPRQTQPMFNPNRLNCGPLPQPGHPQYPIFYWISPNAASQGELLGEYVYQIVRRGEERSRGYRGRNNPEGDPKFCNTKVVVCVGNEIVVAGWASNVYAAPQCSQLRQYRYRGPSVPLVSGLSAVRELMLIEAERLQQSHADVCTWVLGVVADSTVDSYDERSVREFVTWVQNSRLKTIAGFDTSSKFTRREPSDGWDYEYIPRDSVITFFRGLGASARSTVRPRRGEVFQNPANVWHWNDSTWSFY